jgi:hypothetical protein
MIDFTLGARVSPQGLPTGSPAPVGLSIRGRIGTKEERPPAVALREMALSVRNHVEVDVAGLPACPYRHIASRDTRGASRACRKAIVGSGRATAQLVRPEFPWVGLESRLVAFNGGLRHGAIRLFVHAYAPPPLKQTLVARVDLRRDGAAAPGAWKVLAQIPKIGDGYGSLTVFELDLKRFFFHGGERKSFLSARCPDGEFLVSTPKIVFRNEANIPGRAAQTVLKGGLAVPCKPKR